jgi:hypothetical protein
MRRLIVPLFVAFVLAACAGASSGDDPVARSGIRGVVTAGPQCPVVVQGSPCPDRPWSGTVRVATPDGDTVREVETDARGGFSADLEPGSYEVFAVTDPGRPPTAAPEAVQVEEGAFTEIALSVDTGIR